MFAFLKSQEKKMRENAANWLELADKVYHFRRDVLTPAQVTELQGQMAGLRTLVKERAGAEKLKLAIERLEEVLRRTGGAIYPKTALVENVEFFLVAAIVILGIRTYFVQPFKIPTNSMWPTYNGMTPEVFTQKADEPSALAQAGRFLAFGARPRRIDAPAEGEVAIPLYASQTQAALPYREVSGRTWLVLPATLKEYTLFVDDQPVTVQVPQDFDFEWAVRDAFFPELAKAGNPARADLADLLHRQQEMTHDQRAAQLLRTGKHVKRGDRLMAFDIITGDQLFVDRITYHFVAPKVGQGFVFRTDNIHSPEMRDRRTGEQLQQYYIKRLVGVPGDKLEVRQPVLLRNGAPITGADAFGANNGQQGQYRGYFNIGLLSRGDVLTVPPQSYFAMGDNSGNSEDGRYWGFVPAKDVVGRPMFVYYPFTRHWGPAR
jgi:signal peptidase I